MKGNRPRIVLFREGGRRLTAYFSCKPIKNTDPPFPFFDQQSGYGALECSFNDSRVPLGPMPIIVGQMSGNELWNPQPKDTKSVNSCIFYAWGHEFKILVFFGGGPECGSGVFTLKSSNEPKFVNLFYSARYNRFQERHPFFIV